MHTPRTSLQMLFFNIPGRKSIMVAIIGLPEDENKAAWFIEKRHAIPDV
jgi:hypothetical protein